MRGLRLAPMPAALAAIGFCNLLLPGLPVQAQQLPTGGSVVSGSATIHNPAPTQQVITQGSDKAIINWQGFSIGQGHSVQFVQPGSGSVVLNRVVGNDPSAIHGSLSANGRVFLVNPQGIFFSPTASLDVGGLVASTLNIHNDDFLAGRYIFNRDPASRAGAAVINEGLIRARDNGYVVLAGDYAANRGVIEARLGTVALASGAKVTLDLQGDSLISLAVNEKTVAELAGVTNSGALQAEGGRVLMTAAVARDLAGTVVNNSGVVRARGTVEKDGTIYLVGDGGDVSSSGSLDAGGTRGGSVRVQSTGGTTLVSGTIDATGSTGTGGSVQVLGHHAGVTGNAVINASGASGGGTVLIGGDYQGGNAAVQNAQRSYVGADAVIRADATQNGDGGKVIVWADDVTRYYGTISARGGAQGGNGGFAEVSGKASLVFNGTADLRAPQGDAGTLLLDPKNIRITAAGADAVATNDTFADNAAGTSDLSAANVVAAMNGAHLVLQANNDITVETDVNIAGGAGTAGQNLTLQAGRHIILASTPNTATPTSSSGAVTIAMNGGDFSATTNVNTTDAPGFLSANRDPGAAQFFMAAGSAITGAGSATIAAGNNANPSLNANSGEFNVGAISTTGGAISISAFNNINLNGALNSGGGAVNVTADGNLTVTATGSITAGAGTATLTTTETLNADANISLAGNVSAAKVVLNSADAITQTAGGITAGQLRVMAAAGTTDDAVDLGGNNNVGIIAATANAGTGGISSLVFNNGANTLTVGTVDAVSGITAIPTLPSTGQISITAGDLVISQGITTNTGVGTVTLQPSGNTNVNIVDSGATTGLGLTQAELNLITTGTLIVGKTSGSGSLTIGGSGAVTNGSNWNTLILRSGSGGISQTQALTVTNLGVESSGAVNLSNAGNAVTTFAANLSGAGSAVQFREANTLTVGNVGTDALGNPIISGITTSNGNVTLTTGDAVTLNGNVAVGNGVLTLDVTQNGATQGPGAVISTSGTGGVRLIGNPVNTNNFNLNQNNNVANLAASTNGSVTFRNAAGAANTLTVASVGGTNGITTGGSAVTLIADEMALSQNINAGTGSVQLTSSDAAIAINLGTGTAGLNFTDATLERVVTSGQLTIGDNDHTGAITVSGETVNPSNATGGIVLRNRNGGININSSLQAAGGVTSSITLVADGNDPTTATGGTITQGASGGLVANTLTTQSKGGTTLGTAANNAVSNFSAFESGGGDVTFSNTGNLTISGIGLGTNDNVQNIAIDTTGTLSTNGLIATHATNSNVTLSAGGTMTLAQDINPGGTGTLTLLSSSAVTMSGSVISNVASGSGAVANLLLARRGGTGSGAFTLNSATNNFSNAAANISGPLTLVNSASFDVDTVSAVNGINTNGNAVTLVTPGTITLNQSIVASGATVDLTSSGLSSAGGAGVTTGGLAVRDNDTSGPMGTYTLNGVNDIANLAANIKGNLSYTDANAFNVSAVNGVNGITTNGGNVTLSGGSMGITGNITTTGAAISLTTTTGGISQTGGSITGNTLQVNSAGAASLGQSSNNVVTFAASANGAVTYTDLDTVTIGSVGGTNGITSNNNNISVTGTRLLVNRHVDAGTADVTLTTLETAAANDNIELNATPNAVTGTTVRLVSADSIVQAGGATINATNLFTQAESGSNVSANVPGEYWIDVAGLAGGNFTDSITANRVVIWSSSGSPTINQTGGTINASELIFLGQAGSPVFNFNQANTVSTLAASGSYTGFPLPFINGSPTVNFTNAAPLNVGLINTSSYAGSVQGITTNNSNVTLNINNVLGQLSLNEKINAGTGTVNLSVATGGITQSAFAPITADVLNISSPGGAVNLGVANNNLLALNNVNVTGSSFSFREANHVELRGPINVSNVGPVSINMQAAGTLTMTGTGSITATGTGSPATVSLSGTSGVILNSPISVTGGGGGSGVNAGVTLTSSSGPVTMNAGSSIAVTDNGGATPPGSAPHSAEVTITAGSRSSTVFTCLLFDSCNATVRNITATSNNGRAVIDVFGQGDNSTGVHVVGALTAQGQTRPLVRLSTLTQDNDDNILASAAMSIGAPITVISTSSTAVNALEDSVLGGISIDGRDITVGAKLESRHLDGVSRAQDGISINTRNNLAINADIVTTSNGGIGITTGSNGTVSGSGIIEAQNVNLVAPKSQGNFNVRTRIQPPAGFTGNGNLNVLGGDVMTIDNLSGSTLIAALGFIDRSKDPANPDLPIGDLTLKTAGTLQIATLDAYNQARYDRNGIFGPKIPVKIELVSDNFVVFPGTITTPGWAEITLRPYTDTAEIFVRNNADPSLPGVVFTAAPVLGLLQQFHPDAKLIIGGPNHKGDVTVGGDGLFRLGNMHLVFETGQNGKAVKNFFSSDGNVYHPEPVIAFGNLGYPGPNVSDGIGQLTSNRVQLIEAGTFQPNPGVTINGACPAPCPGGSVGQGSVNVSGDSPGGGGGGGGGSGGGGGGGSGGGGTSSGGTDLGGPGATGTGTAAGTGGSGGGGSTTPADSTNNGGGTGGTPTDGTGGGAVADGGGSLSGPADGTITTTTSTDTTPTEDGGGILAGDGGTGPGDGTTPGGGTTIATGDTTPPGGDPGDITFTGGGGGGGTTSGDPGSTGTDPTTGGGPDGGSTLADGTMPGGDGTGLAGGGTGPGGPGGDGTGIDVGAGPGGDSTGTFGGGGSGGGGLAGDSTSGSGGDGLAGGSGTTGLGGDGGGTGGSALADGSGGSGGAGGIGDSLAGGSGDGGFGGGAAGGGLAGDGSGGAGDGTFAGAGGGSGGAGSGGDGSGLGGDGLGGGATGGSSLADGSGATGSSGSGLAGDGSGGSGAGGATGGSGGLVAGSDGGLSDGGFAGGGGSAAQDSGGAGSGVSGGNGGLAGGSGGFLAGGNGSGFGDGSGGGGGSGIAGGSTDIATGDAGGFGGAGMGPAGAGSSGTGTAIATADGAAGSGTGLSDNLRGGASGGGSAVGPGDAGDGGRDGAGRDGSTVARSGTDTSGEFRGGGSGARAAGDAGEESGRGARDGERERYFEDEREAQRIRLVGGSRLISVQGEGVNLNPGNRAPGAR
jgi:filamentous hemagglutinin family protein